MTLRVLTYNIQGCARGLDWVAGTIREAGADVACLQEVHRKHLGRLARLTQRAATFVPGGRFTGFGNAVLARQQPRAIAKRRLSPSPGLEGRALVVARAGDVVVASTHLGLVGDERLRHAREILDALPPEGPLVLGADLNEGPGEPAVALLRTVLRDAFDDAGEGAPYTFPSTNADRRIDYTLSRGFRARSCAVLDATSSDHRPILAELDLA